LTNGRRQKSTKSAYADVHLLKSAESSVAGANDIRMTDCRLPPSVSNAVSSQFQEDVSVSMANPLNSTERYELRVLQSTTVDDYRVRSLLGSGGMGIVFKVTCTKPNHPKPNALYALKVLLNYGIGDSKFSSFCRAEWNNGMVATIASARFCI